MKRAIKNMASRMIRVVGLLVLLGWAGTMPVMAAEPVYISTAAELTTFATRVNAGEITLDGVLTADIVLRVDAADWAQWATTPPTDPTQWTPIGDNTNSYAGTFDGAGHTVSGIYINSVANDQGLFGVTTDTATITNLGVIDSSIIGGDYTGGIVGRGGGDIINCHNTGCVNGTEKVGGVAGQSEEEVINCYNTGSVTGTNGVGGVIGTSYMSIVNCYNAGSVTGTNYQVGGVVGLSLESIDNCYNVGSVIGTEKIGGVAGQSVKAVINCYNTGSVTGTNEFGGVVGLLNDSSTNCYYLDESAAKGISNQEDAPGIMEPKLASAFESGEVTWRLQNGQTVPVWGQKLVGPVVNMLPLLQATDQVCCVTFQAGNGISAETEVYVNKDGNVTPPVPASGYDWKDTNQVVLTADTAITEDISVKCGITTLPTATAIYGTKLGEIALVGSSVTAGAWNWEDQDKETVLAVGNTTAYSATYTPSDTVMFATETVPIIPVIILATGGGSGSGGGGTLSMPGVNVTLGTITFDPAGNMAVGIIGAPAGSVVSYSLDGITYTTTSPPITSAGEHKVWIKVTCPGYQDYHTEIMVTVAKQKALELPQIPVRVPAGQSDQSFDLGTMLPVSRGNTQFTVSGVDDPGQILAGAPTIDAAGKIRLLCQSPLAPLAAKTATVTVLATMENYEDTTLTLVVSEAEPIGVRYLTHIQDIGWETDWVTDGALSGTSGQSKRLEALKVELTGDLPEGASIKTSVHVQNQGNLGPFAMGTAAGTSGQGLRLENICLTLENLPGYTLRYNVHVQNQGWQRDETDSSSWFQSGETAGTAGQGLRLEGIQIRLVKAE